jgi:ribosomal protein S18 acetylase RimI-like enzyme
MDAILQPIVRRCEESDLPKLQATLPSGHQKRFAKQQAGTAEYLIAWVNNQPAGFFLLDWLGQQYLPGVPEISGGEVRADLRSHGIGAALIKACEQRAKQHGAKQICLLVAHDNPNARRLYEHLGYQDSGIEDVVAEYDDTNAAGVTKHFREECALLLKDLM